MLKLLPVLLISMLLGSKNTIAEERWFQIEVITFINPSNANNVNEKYPLIQMQPHAFDQEIIQSNSFNIELVRYFQGYPVLKLTNESAIQNEVHSTFNINKTGISSASNRSLSSGSRDARSNFNQPKEQPFIALKNDERLLRDKFRQLDRNGRFQILSFQAWRQHVGSERDAINIRINGGLNYNHQYDSLGYPLNKPESSNALNTEAYKQEQLANNQETVVVGNYSAGAASANDTDYSNNGFNSDNSIGFQPFQEPMQTFLNSKWNQRNVDDIWELDGSVKVYIKKRYLHLMTQLALREPAEFAKFKYLEQQRKQHSIESENLSELSQANDNREKDAESELNSIAADQSSEETLSAIDQYLNNSSSSSSLTTSSTLTPNLETAAPIGQSDNLAMKELAEIAALEKVMDNKPSAGIVEYHLNTTRRLKSTEYHYIDHPKFGVLFLITPYTPDHLRQKAD
jgi:hypothetical protein